MICTFCFNVFFCVPGCKVEMFFLNVEAVNTHRDRPLVSGPDLSHNLQRLLHHCAFSVVALQPQTWSYKQHMFVVYTQGNIAKHISGSQHLNQRLTGCPVCCVSELKAITHSLRVRLRWPPSLTSLFCFVPFILNPYLISLAGAAG